MLAAQRGPARIPTSLGRPLPRRGARSRSGLLAPGGASGPGPPVLVPVRDFGNRMDHQPTPRSCSRGPPACESVQSDPSMNVFVHTTTGARYELSVPVEETVEGLKRRLSQRLKVPKERLALLHKERRLSSGKLQDLGVSEGSKLTLVPTVEAGLMSQASRPEQSVMQALESLTETQVNDFLSGRSPLTLALRVGDHMMFVQLQLAAQQSGVQLQHRHVVASRGEQVGGPAATAPLTTASPAGPGCRPLHSGSPAAPDFARVPTVPACQPSPPASPTAVPSPAQATPAYCSPAHPTPITAGMFRSHGAGTQAVGGSGIVSPCSEVSTFLAGGGVLWEGRAGEPAALRSVSPCRADGMAPLRWFEPEREPWEAPRLLVQDLAFPPKPKQVSSPQWVPKPQEDIFCRCFEIWSPPKGQAQLAWPSVEELWDL
ncbi:Midnolin-B [Varanus komodoensis]|nr:Midnolin-B [Varanus komodoensis]